MTNTRDAALPISLAQQNAIVRIEHMLMAPCCYTQTIDGHNSNIADKMRVEVRTMILAGRSEQEILGYYKRLYGRQILAMPDGTLGQFVFGLPVAVASVATGVLILVLRRFHERKLAVSAGGSVEALTVS